MAFVVVVSRELRLSEFWAWPGNSEHLTTTAKGKPVKAACQLERQTKATKYLKQLCRGFYCEHPVCLIPLSVFSPLASLKLKHCSPFTRLNAITKQNIVRVGAWG